MKIVLITSNPQKIPEYRAIFGRYNVVIEWFRPEGKEVDIKERFSLLDKEEVKAVLQDESNLFSKDGKTIGDDISSGLAVNRCKVTGIVKVKVGGNREVKFLNYSGLVEGHIVAASSVEPGVFSWDNRFVPVGHRHTLHDLRLQGMKCSARDVALSRFIEEHLDFKDSKILQWSECHETEDKVDLSREGSVDRFVSKNPYLYDLQGLPGKLLWDSVKGGIFFRRKTNRRDGNYWQPGLNGGLPYTPKKDPIHEVTYLYHDIMHHLLPDFCYDGSEGPNARTVYMVSRMMSEAWSLVFADMLFVDNLNRNQGVEYDWSKRKIYPLYQRMGHYNVKEILKMMTEFVILGEDNFPECPEKEEFVKCYTPFFTADWRWTNANWEALSKRQISARNWVAMAGGDQTFQNLGLVTLGDAIRQIGEVTDLKEITNRVFDFWYARVFENPPVLEGNPHNNAIRRWALGQLAAWARYAPVTPVSAGWKYVKQVILNPNGDGVEGRTVREVVNTYFDVLDDLRVISSDDHRIFSQAFPHFDPFFVDYKGEDGLTLPQVVKNLFPQD